MQRTSENQRGIRRLSLYHTARQRHCRSADRRPMVGNGYLPTSALFDVNSFTACGCVKMVAK